MIYFIVYLLIILILVLDILTDLYVSGHWKNITIVEPLFIYLSII